MKKSKTWPNPGSREAQDAGCTCPVLDNSHGAGYMGMKGVFVFSGGCPVHDSSQPKGKRKETRK